jgi:Predicted Co/Zn/Cd cation transporters
VTASGQTRAMLVRRGERLTMLTLAYNTLEGVASLVAGAFAGSISLIGFGADSVIEVVSSIAALWRLRADVDEQRRVLIERRTLRLIGATFLALALYILIEAAHSLFTREASERSVVGIFIAGASVVIMPILARAKRRIAIALDSRALAADAMQTSLCAWLSWIVLGGLVLNATLGWWWADPIAGICMTPIIAREGIEGLRGQRDCADC